MKKLYLKNDDISESVLYVKFTNWNMRLKHIFKKYSFTTHFEDQEMIEYGPVLNIRSPFSSNVSNIFDAIDISGIERIEKTTRILATHFKSDLLDPIVDIIYEKPIDDFKDTFHITPLKNEIVPFSEIESFGKSHGLAFDTDDINYYTNLFQNVIGRDPSSTELYDLSQGNSEHSRHWFFNGIMCVDGTNRERSLFDKIREPLNHIRRVSKTHDISLVAFSDNASAIRNYSTTVNLLPSNPYMSSKYIKKYELFHPTLTAETHNFPTGIAPFQGAETGVGGRIRDTQAIGRGGIPLAGLAGYCVADFKSPATRHSAIDILYKASDGASDYGNKFGEPLVGGFCRSFGDKFLHEDNTLEHREWYKPIMFSAGIGLVHNECVFKDKPKIGMLIVKLGGPAYRIGIGGGSASSRTGGTGDDLSAVQRGDAEMENRLNRVIRAMAELGHHNPIRLIHDQGAGGTSNVSKEIIEPFGSIIDIDAVICGDDTMTPMEIWIAEYQEQNTILVDKGSIYDLKILCKRERLPIAIIGEILDRPNVTVKSSKIEENDGIILDLPIKEVLTNISKKTYHLETIDYRKRFDTLKLSKYQFETYLKQVLKLPSVCSKHFLTSKVDRSVSGLVVRNQSVGPFNMPLSNFSIVATSYLNTIGTVSSIGEQPLKGLYNPKNMVNMAIGEMLTNMVGAYIGDINCIRCSGNWMWANDDNKNKMMLNDAVDEVKNTLIKLGIAIDGGKDSLSMSQMIDGKRVRSPNQFVITGYTTMRDFRSHVTPDFKREGNSLVYIDLGHSKNRIGGSALCQVLNSYDFQSPDFEYIERFPKIFNILQMLILSKNIVSLHDRSDGGLITTLTEMAISSNYGAKINILNDADLFHYFFSEELGIVVEIKQFEKLYTLLGHVVPVIKIGVITKQQKLTIDYNLERVLDINLSILRSTWESTSFDILECMTDKECVDMERAYVDDPKNFIEPPNYQAPFCWYKNRRNLGYDFTVGIIREEGSNGDREMAFAFHDAGFNVIDINMNDLVKKPHILNSLKGVAFVGGFSYADALGAGVGWSSSIILNKSLMTSFEYFKNREDTFSLGVCNGCQLMTQLGWVDAKLERNKSKRFESRYTTVRITDSNSILLRDMFDTLLGVWIAHGEGRFTDIGDTAVPIYYTDKNGVRNMNYPINPNGSDRSAAAVCSLDGRHLAMMPHPERCVLNWQNPYVPPRWKDNKYYPWRKLFTNAYDFCQEYIYYEKSL